ncbi:alpha-ketoglutarate-dependent dioxygenase AlkB [Alteromonas sp. D210916BOD_24]|uniref:alpha-ketoglutarate-dependent dioxygenase AlkB family protein n=1 Tax=Alteromonas sp. D210916BOD_24 TaxID=3157618 RepID=UPI00399CB44D
MQYSLFDAEPDSASPLDFETLPLSEGDVRYYPNALPMATASLCYESLKTELPWRQDNIKLFGKSVAIPRLQSWHGDPQCTYTYSNLTMSPNPWTETLTELRHVCEKLCMPFYSKGFNSVLANWYRDGQDSMSLHADNEPELGPNPVIASLTLGEARPFTFKHKETHARYTRLLEHGSVLVMAGATQSHYLHGIAKTKKPINGRINLTFRQLLLRTR